MRTGNALERRAEPLRTSTVADNRSSRGCINVPAACRDRHVQTVFTSLRTAEVHVMPETRALQQQFGVSEEPSLPARPPSP